MAAQNSGNKPGTKNVNRVIASNRKARHDYAIEDTFECGIVLLGSEVKSMREGHIQVADAYARILRGQVWLDGVHIPPYQFAHGIGAHDPNR
ncbi:MAG: SsrA-binding protein, partial [Actinomycetota bacterium]